MRVEIHLVLNSTQEHTTCVTVVHNRVLPSAAVAILVDVTVLWIVPEMTPVA